MDWDLDDSAIGGSGTDNIRRIPRQVEEADFERVDPPTDLWERIEASITSDSALSLREPLSREVPASMVVEYWIDASDVVADVGQSWASFAMDNDAHELAVPASDRTLWTYFNHDEIRELWQLLVERVRALQKKAHVSLRCDAHHARRWYDMTITPESDGRVHFRSVLAFDETRPPVSLLDINSVRDDGLRPVPLCSWCGRGEHGSLWLDIEELVQAARLLEQASLPPISYGICGSCRDEMSADLLVPGVVGEPTT
ncbi:MAG: hypothetical protein HOJ56_04905 [Acidimicrobiaceae bacterium]|nr:hypothetical protein [Acidimicrobiaceae bacterium]